jgi:hypothetical protein
MKDSKTSQNTRKKDYNKKMEFSRQSLFQDLKRFFPQENPEEKKDTNSYEKSDHLKNHGSDKLDTNSSFTSSSNITLQEKVQSRNSEGPNDDISFIHNLKNYYSVKLLKDKKNVIIRAIALVFGILLIIYGVTFSLTGSSVQVASNVIFGDRAMFSALLVLIGSLIIATVFARKLREATFLKTIYSELETLEGKTQKNKDDHVTEEDEGNDND